ncbi:putative protein-serine/threonine phosphatase [Helianthus annuus]|nr:putative protein-serine/threonine phosphatase [Helianthus annuus]
MELQQLKLIATAASSIISLPESNKKPHENEVQPCCAKTTTTTSKSFGDDVLVKESSRFGLTAVFGRRDLEDAVAVRPWFCKTICSDLHSYGVIDGHGCSHVVTKCKDRMHE